MQEDFPATPATLVERTNSWLSNSVQMRPNGVTLTASLPTNPLSPYLGLSQA